MRENRKSASERENAIGFHIVKKRIFGGGGIQDSAKAIFVCEGKEWYWSNF